MTYSRPQKLTNRQATLLGFICESIDQDDTSPTLRELGDLMDISSTNGVNDHVRALVRKGYLDSTDNHEARALRPLRYPNGRPFLRRRHLIAALERSPTTGDVAEEDALELATMRIAELEVHNDLLQRNNRELRIERAHLDRGLRDAHILIDHRDEEIETLEGQVDELQAGVAALRADLGVGRKTIPASILRALQTGSTAPVVSEFAEREAG